MNKRQRLAALKRSEAQLRQASTRLRRLVPHLQLECDIWALQHLLGSLEWAIENSSVIAQHQLGRKLDDDMGFFVPAKLKFKSLASTRVLPRGVTIEAANRRQLQKSTRP
jgi:hypothetical protein